MAYTTHGHHYGPTIEGEHRPQLVARCGGPGLCSQCSAEATPQPPQGAAGQAVAVSVGDLPVKRIEVLRLEPRDILVVTVEDHLPDWQLQRTYERVRAGLGEQVKVMVVERAELSVIRGATAEDR